MSNIDNESALDMTIPAIPLLFLLSAFFIGSNKSIEDRY